MFLGYEEGSKAYWLYDQVGSKVVVSLDVVFDEAAAWKWDEAEEQGSGRFGDTFVMERLTIHGREEESGEPATEKAGDAAAPEVVEPPSPVMAFQSTQQLGKDPLFRWA